MKARISGKSPFLWPDETPEGRRRVQHSEILASPAGKGGRTSVLHGLIHHWVGAVFIPDTKLDQVLAVAHDYDRSEDFFKPAGIGNCRGKCQPSAAGDRWRGALVGESSGVSD
jgi:hypothetical protein